MGDQEKEPRRFGKTLKIMLCSFCAALVLLSGIVALIMFRPRASDGPATAVASETQPSESVPPDSAPLMGSEDREMPGVQAPSAEAQESSGAQAPPDEEALAETQAPSSMAQESSGAQETGLDFVRRSALEIELSWMSVELDQGQVESYLLKRRNTENNEGIGAWELLREVSPDGLNGDGLLTAVDTLENDEPQQYEYRVDMKVVDDHGLVVVEGTPILASNQMVCIDPGHYGGVNAITGEEAYGYAEGDFTLELSLKLKAFLKEYYGIDACMTRDSASIMIDGYADAALDNTALALRGEYAARYGSDLFVSVHTNANEEGANGYDTCMQPVSLNKTVIIVNQPARASDPVIHMCNVIGECLALESFQMGLSTVEHFNAVDKNELSEWSESYNDGLEQAGTVVFRDWNGQDYYGVLRGAANENIPGMIIEHGMHTIPEMRRQAMTGDLSDAWAWADAFGIACGFGFIEEEEYVLYEMWKPAG